MELAAEARRETLELHQVSYLLQQMISKYSRLQASVCENNETAAIHTSNKQTAEFASTSWCI